MLAVPVIEVAYLGHGVADKLPGSYGLLTGGRGVAVAAKLAERAADCCAELAERLDAQLGGVPVEVDEYFGCAQEGVVGAPRGDLHLISLPEVAGKPILHGRLQVAGCRHREITGCLRLRGRPGSPRN